MAVSYTITPGNGGVPVTGALPFEGQVDTGWQTIVCTEAGHAEWSASIYIERNEEEQLIVVMTPLA